MTATRRMLVFAALAVLGPTALAACANAGAATAPTTVAAATDALDTGLGPSSTGTTSTTSTLAPSTTSTTEALPVPSPAPDPHAPEPRVELGTIEIPKIGVSMTMFQGVSLTVLDRGPGHWPGTAMPGHSGNVVIAGHRTSHAKPFRNIDQLVAGDQVIFTTPEGRFVYEVTGSEIVLPTAMRIIAQTTEPTATLFACHPPGSTRERIVVHLALKSA